MATYNTGVSLNQFLNFHKIGPTSFNYLSRGINLVISYEFCPKTNASIKKKKKYLGVCISDIEYT